MNEETFRRMGNILRREILPCDNILLFESDRDFRVILRIEDFINSAKLLFPQDSGILEITSHWDSMPNLHLKTDALATVDSLMKLTSKNLFLEWGKLFEKNQIS